MTILPSVYSVENVTKGHPDRVCDQIADALLHAYEQADPYARVAIEVLGTAGHVLITGEVTSSAHVDAVAITQRVLRDVGYDETLPIQTLIHEQSREIGGAVDQGGAGDQGVMYGFACDETPEQLPLGVALTRRWIARLEHARESGLLPWLKSDGKVQVTMRNGIVETVVLSTQHTEDVSLEELQRAVREHVLLPELLSQSTEPRILINPAGRWTVGGFTADTGLTGRKLACDTYGGLVQNGGGSTHGKDLTKVDRSASIRAREVAQALVSAGHAKECLVSVAYAIGIESPVMLEAVNERGESLAHLVDPSRFLVGELVKN